MLQNDFSVSKDHLCEVGEVRVVNSPTYGKYKMRCVANIDWFPLDVSINDAMKWFEKYHPTKIGAASLIISDSNARNSRFSSIFLPLNEDNKDWYTSNKDCEYIKTTEGRDKKFPIGLSDKILKKWLDATERFIVT